MLHVVFEARPHDVVVWADQQWEFVNRTVAEHWIKAGEAHRWPDRATAESLGFVPPPVAIVFEDLGVRMWDGIEWVPIARSEAEGMLDRGEAFRPAESLGFARNPATKPQVAAIVFEGRQAYQWAGREWMSIKTAMAETMLERGDEAYRWPDRATAESHEFVPPPVIRRAPPTDAASDRVAARLKKWGAACGWVAVADRLPTGWTVCMVTDGEEIACRTWIAELREWMEMESAEYPVLEDMDITHWLACPAPPR